MCMSVNEFEDELVGVICPLLWEVDTWLGACGTKQSKPSWRHRLVGSVRKAMPLAIFHLAPKSGAPHKLPVAILHKVIRWKANLTMAIISPAQIKEIHRMSCGPKFSNMIDKVCDTRGW